MPVWQRIGLFGVTGVAVFGIGLALGGVVGPVETSDAHDDAGHGDRMRLTPAAETYEVVLDDEIVPSRRTEVRFQVLDGEGEPVTSYDVQHDKELHLIAARRDLADYRHVHPELDPATGTWSVPLTLSAGDWRLYADFLPSGGEATVAETDLRVSGDYGPRSLGPDTDHAEVDGYDVHLERDTDTSMASLTVSRDGAPVTDLQPYLGAHGHLVAIRAGDLTYLHVHPEDTGAGPELKFHAEFPSEGRYRLFLDFKHGDAVHTADFTLTTAGSGHGEPGGHDDHGDPAPEDDPTPEEEGSHGGDGHDH